MKNYFSFLILFLALVISTDIYSSEIPSDNKKNKISVTERSNVADVEVSTFNSIDNILSSKENIKVEYYGILCRMTVSGTTVEGIKYRISGRCAKVKRALKAIGAI